MGTLQALAPVCRVKGSTVFRPAGRCRPNVAGRRCDSCAPGFHGYPHCRPCQCHEAGTAPSICDPLTGHCHCKVSSLQAPVLHTPQLRHGPQQPFWVLRASWKFWGWRGDSDTWLGQLTLAARCPQENVQGPRCDQCRLGTFSLEATNPKGCTRCFCFGATERCRSSVHARHEVSTRLGTQAKAGTSWGRAYLPPPVGMEGRMELWGGHSPLCDPPRARSSWTWRAGRC